jgi:ubiquinol-cytochrome c reductase cytochrome b subunit
MAWPFIERKMTGDRAHHNLLQRPRDVPVRTAIGAMAIAFYTVLTLSAMNDIIALNFHISLNAMTWIGRVGMVVVPPLVYFLAYRWAIALQRSDRDVLAHGLETGILRRLPHGAYIEMHQPLVTAALEYQGAPVPKRPNKLGLAGAPGSGSLLRADPPDERRVLAALGERRESS